MGLETGTFISDLVATNPLGTDVESQGANHLRLIKLLVQNTFPGASKAWPFPTVASKSANYSVAKADFNTLFAADTTGGAFTFTLPTLAAGDANWSCQFMKVNANTNRFMIAPPSGTLASGEISGLTTARRCIPLRATTALWTGSVWILTRVPSIPVGCMIPYASAALPLPVGYEYPNGQSFSAAAYPELNAITSATSVDLRGRAPFGKDDMGGGAAGVITTAGSGLDGTSLGSTGGAQNKVLIQDNLPNINSTISGITFNGSPQTVNIDQNNVVRNAAQAAGGSLAAGNALSPNSQLTVTFTPTGTVSGGAVAWPNIGQAGGTSFIGKGTAAVTLSPATITQYLLVVE